MALNAIITATRRMAAAPTLMATRALSAQALREKSGMKERYGNFINGEFVAPLDGEYFDNVSPINGEVVCQAPRSKANDVDLALDAAHAAFPAWGKTSVAERSNMLLKIADALEKNIDRLALLETIDNGKPIRETTAADIPLVVDHFRYFAGCLRADEGKHLSNPAQ
ncbi:uncharacterized protein MONBRDRAFT_26572, partial [Monosiga brevicollis MX1]